MIKAERVEDGGVQVTFEGVTKEFIDALIEIFEMERETEVNKEEAEK